MFKNLSYLIILLFSAATSLQAEEREYVIVVHGGAGNVGKLENDPGRSAQYYAALDSALTIGDQILSAGGEGPQAVMAVINYFKTIRYSMPVKERPVRLKVHLNSMLP